MMEMADNPKLDLATSMEAGILEEATQKISVLDHINGFQCTTERPDSFVIDMDSFSNPKNKDINNPNSRITLQRSLSRKWSQRGSEKKMNSNTSANDKEVVVATSSPRGPSAPEKAVLVAAGTTTDHSSNPQVHHQITITTGNISAKTEGRSTIRRNSFKRSPSSWTIDPKRVLFFFATLSSVGTLLLIYFTLSMGKLNADEVLD